MKTNPEKIQSNIVKLPSKLISTVYTICVWSQYEPCVHVYVLVCWIPGLLLWVEGAKLFIANVHTVYEENRSTITNTFINAVTT